MAKLPYTPDRQINPDENKKEKQLFCCNGSCGNSFFEEELTEVPVIDRVGSNNTVKLFCKKCLDYEMLDDGEERERIDYDV